MTGPCTSYPRQRIVGANIFCTRRQTLSAQFFFSLRVTARSSCFLLFGPRNRSCMPGLHPETFIWQRFVSTFPVLGSIHRLSFFTASCPQGHGIGPFRAITLSCPYKYVRSAREVLRCRQVGLSHQDVFRVKAWHAATLWHVRSITR